jgi:ATPase subunit of ABC transporter with duplicated ATPase domains
LKRFGGPILYLIVYGFVLFGVLIWWDSGAVYPFKGWRSRKPLRNHTSESNATPADVAAEADAVANSQDSLRVVNATKVYGGNAVVDGVSFGVAQGDVLALLGPNGAGKTTTFDMIRTFTNLRGLWMSLTSGLVYQEVMSRRRRETSLSTESRSSNILVARDFRWAFALSSRQLMLN